MKRLAVVLLSIVILTSAAMGQQVNRAVSSHGSAGQAALEQAAAANKFAFLFFWKERNPHRHSLDVAAASGRQIGRCGRSCSGSGI